MFSSLPEYTELHCLSNFTFLRGASHPEELVHRAAGLGYHALATTRESYGNLSELLTRGRRRSKKGRYSLAWSDLDGGLPGCLALLIPPHPSPLPKGEGEKHACSIAERFPGS